jgi:murein L,D-transpeptidase YcbB/YkuD
VSRISRSSTALAAVLLALAGCNFTSSGGEGGGGGGGAATAQAEGVTPEALQAAVKDEPLRRFYEARQWQSAWNEEAGEQLKGSLRNAANHGIDPAIFMREVEGAGSPVEKEVALSRAALTYADALAHGRTDPTKLFEDYTLPRNQVDVPAGLAQAVGQNQAPQWIEGLAPQDEEYRALSQAYVQQLQGAQQPQQGQQGQPGQQPQQNQDNAKSKDQPKAKAKEQSKQKQAEKAVPAAPRERAVVLAVNMERRRWLPRQPEATRIDVNTAGTFLKVHPREPGRGPARGRGWRTRLGNAAARLAHVPPRREPQLDGAGIDREGRARKAQPGPAPAQEHGA